MQQDIDINRTVCQMYRRNIEKKYVYTVQK